MNSDGDPHREPAGRAGGAREDRVSRVARLSALGFGSLGVGLVLAGVASIGTGTPHQAYNLAPVSSVADALGRVGELTPLAAAALAALVAASVVLQLATRRVHALSAAAELIVLGTAVEVCIAGSIGRVGYAVDGSVLVAGVACLTGGAALLSSGIVATLVRE